MSTQPTSPQENIDLSVRRVRFIWLGLLVSYAAFYLVTLLNPRPEDLEPNNTLFLIFVAVGLTTTLGSFVVKQRFLSRAEEEQKVELVQQGYVVASAITEVAAMLGVFDYFRTGDRYYYVLFIIAACGQLFHYPRRDPFLNATFKTSTL